MGSAVAVIALAMVAALGNAQAEPPSVLQYRYDASRARSWALAREGVLVHDGASGRKVRVELPQWLWLDDPYCPYGVPDLVLAPDGAAIITSNVVPTLWRIDARTLAVSVHPLRLDADGDRDVGFAAIVYSPDERAYFAYSEMQRTLWKIDVALKSASKVRQAQRASRALSARCPDRQ